MFKFSCCSRFFSQGLQDEITRKLSVSIIGVLKNEKAKETLNSISPNLVPYLKEIKKTGALPVDDKIFEQIMEDWGCTCYGGRQKINEPLDSDWCCLAGRVGYYDSIYIVPEYNIDVAGLYDDLIEERKKAQKGAIAPSPVSKLKI